MCLFQRPDPVTENIPIQYLLINVSTEHPPRKTRKVGIAFHQRFRVKQDCSLQLLRRHFAINRTTQLRLDLLAVQTQIQVDGRVVNARSQIFPFPENRTPIRLFDQQQFLLVFVDRLNLIVRRHQLIGTLNRSL